MAKEMILVPKVKYERLLQKLEPVDTSSRENDHQVLGKLQKIKYNQTVT